MSPNQKLSGNDRRALTLRALRGESVVQLSGEYGVARSWIYALKEEARINHEKNLEESRKEHEFWQTLSAESA